MEGPRARVFGGGDLSLWSLVLDRILRCSIEFKHMSAHLWTLVPRVLLEGCEAREAVPKPPDTATHAAYSYSFFCVPLALSLLLIIMLLRTARRH